VSHFANSLAFQSPSFAEAQLQQVTQCVPQIRRDADRVPASTSDTTTATPPPAARTGGGEVDTVTASLRFQKVRSSSPPASTAPHLCRHWHDDAPAYHRNSKESCLPHKRNTVRKPLVVFHVSARLQYYPHSSTQTLHPDNHTQRSYHFANTGTVTHFSAGRTCSRRCAAAYGIARARAAPSALNASFCCS
jgi:hypothetical protein